MEGLRERRRPRQPVHSNDRYHEKAPLEFVYVKRRYVQVAAIVLAIFAIQLLILAFMLGRRAIAKGFAGKTNVNLATNQASGRQLRTGLTAVTSSFADTDAEREPHKTLDVLITIYAYDRPRQLLHLLRDIAREADLSKLRIGVNVIDDNSLGCISQPAGRNIFEDLKPGSEDRRDEPMLDVGMQLLDVVRLFNSSTAFQESAPCSARSRFRHVESFLRKRGWRLYVSRYRHGRRRYWHLVRMAMSLLKSRPANYYLFLPDDDRLASNFFGRALGAWKSITDDRRATLMLHIEESRETGAVWTNVKPRFYGGGLYRIGWVESGNFLCDNRLPSFLNWSFPSVPVERWVLNPPISSGVGSSLSELLHSAGLRMYRTEQSLVAHVGVRLSKMNAEFRARNGNSLLTKNFVDGDKEYARLLQEASTVSASMATIWTREAALHAAIDSLAPQVDRLNVYLNGYDVVPVFLQQPFIAVAKSQDPNSGGELGDIGKFHWCNSLDTEYHMTVDDDIVYPDDYVETLLKFRAQYRSPVIVGVHGIRIKNEDLVPQEPAKRGKGYYGSREVWMAVEEVSRPVTVHILGTGTILYNPQDIGTIDVGDVFREPNMADIWLGGLAQRLRIPMIVVPHNANWIQEVPGTFEGSIYHRSTRRRSSDRVQTRVAKSFAPWVLHEPHLV